jgi:hypothetical protein
MSTMFSVKFDYRTWWRRYGFATLVIVIVLATQVLPCPRPVDDAYITFRYARNLVAGQGFVYNAGQPVLGTTTPLFTLALATSNTLLPGIDFPWLALLISAVCDVVTILLLRRLVKSLTRSAFVATTIALAYLLNPIRSGVALGGMETSLVVLWLIAAAEAYVTRAHFEQAALFGALATLTRPDALLLPGLIFLYDIIVRRRIPWKAIGVYAAVLAPWLILATAYFGSPLPLSITAKTQAYVQHSALALTTLVDFLVLRIPFHNDHVALAVLGVGLAVLILLYVAGARAVWRYQRRSLPVVIYPLLYVLGLSLANPVIFVWYYPPLLVFFDMIVLLGVAALLQVTKSQQRCIAFAGVLCAVLLLQWRGAGELVQRWPIDLRQREIAYERAAAELIGLIKPDQTIALPEIGVFGYVFDRARIIDTVGLVSPEAIPYLLKERAPGQEFNYAISPEVMTTLQPDYLITLEIFARPTLLQSPEFLQNYRLVQTYTASDFDSRGLLVFERNPGANGQRAP